jgi:hypothetical protein
VTCADCGTPCRNDPDETGNLCEECCRDRDQWAAAYQVRMAKAPLRPSAVVPVVVEVALEPVSSAAGVVEVTLVPIVPAARKEVA